MDTIKIAQAEMIQEAERHIRGGIHKIGYIVIERPVVLVCSDKQVDELTCKELGYDVVVSHNNGGTILVNNGDIIFSHLDKPYNGWLNGFATYFVDWLNAKGLNAMRDGNDILVDGYKVCGLCITRYGRIEFSSCVVGINTKLDHIKKICKKPMNKIPKGLSEYGITTEEVEEALVGFFDSTPV